jgi:hypothetical protein
MYIRQGISIGNLLLDTSNYRIIRQDNQKGARDAIIAEQGKKLVKLAEDIVEHGVNPFDLPMVIDAEDGHQNYIVIEGNRRLTAITLMLHPELAKDTPVQTAFSRLHKQHGDSIPKVLDCVIAPNKSAALVWINRKHANGLEGAGTEPWSAMAKARADVEQGIARPDLEVVNCVLSSPHTDNKLRAHLEGASFNLTTLQRLVTTKELQDALGMKLQGGELVSSYNRDWVQKVLTDVVSSIYKAERNGAKFTERQIDSADKRKDFVEQLIADHPGRKKVTQGWVVTGTVKTSAAAKKKDETSRATPSTGEQLNLVPKKFKLELPSGKVNDIFVELKRLDVTTYRHSVSVLFRVFFELSLRDYIESNKIALPKDNKGREIDKLSVRLSLVLTHVKAAKKLTAKELKPIEVAISNENSFLAPDTLNAYVHSPWMNPEPLQLKLAWANMQPFVAYLWGSKKELAKSA